MARRKANVKPSRPRIPPSQGGRLIFSEAIPSTELALDPLVGRAVRAIVEACAVNGSSTAIEMALREALANAVLHGNRRDQQKPVEVDCYEQDDGSVLLVVRDQGRGFDPSRVDNPTKPENIFREAGRGIFLIRHFMDEVAFRRKGTEIRMRKKL